MQNSKEFLRKKSCITEGDVVFLDIVNLMQYTKLVQLETMLEFMEDNHPEAHGMMNTMKFEIRAIMKEIKESQEDTNTLNY